MRVLRDAVATRLAELEASANMSVEGANVSVEGAADGPLGGGKEGSSRAPWRGSCPIPPSRRVVRADLNAPTCTRDARYPLGVRWSEEQLMAAGLRRTVGRLERVGDTAGEGGGGDAMADARETVAKVSKSLRAAAARLRERRFRSLTS